MSPAWRCCCPLAARTSHEATSQFSDVLCLALSCITNEVPQVQRPGQPGALRAATLARARRLALNGSGFQFGLSLQYRVREAPTLGGWVVELASYAYSLFDRDGRELLVYHWHPEWEGDRSAPHLHLGAALLDGAFKRAFAPGHWPTGLVDLPGVLGMLITELAEGWS